MKTVHQDSLCLGTNQIIIWQPIWQPIPTQKGWEQAEVVFGWMIWPLLVNLHRPLGDAAAKNKKKTQDCELWLAKTGDAQW